VGIAAALQSLRFVFNHPGAFARLVLTWAGIYVAVIIAYALLVKPAGLTLAQQLDGGDGSGGRLLALIPSFLGNLAVSVLWVRYILLDEVPRNPVALRAEMGIYFGRSLQVGILGFLAALPGLIVGYAVSSALQSARTASTVIFIVFVVIAFLSALTVYARLQVMLAIAAIGDSTTVRDTFDLTKGRTLGLIGGWLLSYAPPVIVLAVVQILTRVVSTSGFATVGAVAAEVVNALYTFGAATLLAGFTAFVLQALDPQHSTDKIAREFT
jgi:hypothetical protein